MRDLGLCGTEEVYFATDHLGAGAGIMVTASQNPIEHNSFKLIGPGARALSVAEFRSIEVIVAALPAVHAEAAAGTIEPDARVRWTATWIRQNMTSSGHWNNRRLIVFTEYQDTRLWLHNRLPILATDDEIYRRLPAFIVATIDKFAALPWVGQTDAFFGHVDRADIRGFYGASEPRSGARLSKG